MVVTIRILLTRSVKNIGLFMGNSMNWGVHVPEVNCKVFVSLRSLYRLKNFLPFDDADEYCSDLNKDLLNKLEHLYNNCIRYIFNVRKCDHVSQYRSQLK